MGKSADEMLEQRRDQYVAWAVGIPVEDLEGHPYELDENASGETGGFAWRVNWQENPPPGVAASGPEGSQWSEITPYDWAEDGDPDQ